jgi:hypothetical protein
MHVDSSSCLLARHRGAPIGAAQGSTIVAASAIVARGCGASMAWRERENVTAPAAVAQ